MNRALFVLFTTVCCFSCKQKMETSVASQMIGLKDSLTIELNGFLEQGHINGFGVAIVNRDTTLYRKGFGYTRSQEKVPYTENTLQNIASVSKTLIGVALLKAQEMGKLDMNDPINQYLPFKVVNPFNLEVVITIKHLATHTSGIKDGDLYGSKSYIMANAGDEELAKSLPSSKEFNLPHNDMEMGAFLKNFLSEQGDWYDKSNYLKNKPGERYEYTNVGATLAAYIIELATGQTYATFTTQHILNPLKMSGSGWTFDTVDTSKLTKLYTVDGKEIPRYRLITYPDGGLITSVADKAKYLSELIRGYSGNGRLLSKSSYEQLFLELLTKDNFEEERDTKRPFDDEYNSGLFIGHTPIGYIGHMGGDPGVSTFMFFNPKTKIGKLLFVNTDLDQKGAEQFYAIWDTLGEYEIALNNSLSQRINSE